MVLIRKLVDVVKSHIKEGDVEKTMDCLDLYLNSNRSKVKFSPYLDDCEGTVSELKEMKDNPNSGQKQGKKAKTSKKETDESILKKIEQNHLIENMEELDKQIKEAPVLKIDKDFDSFSEEDFRKLNEVLKDVLPDDARIKILGVKKGSVEVMLEISEVDMAKLLIAIKDEKVLAMIGITTIEFRSMRNVEKPVTREDNIRLLLEKKEKLTNDQIETSDSEEEFDLEQQIKKIDKRLAELRGE